MTCMSRAAGRPWHQLGRRTSAGLLADSGSKFAAIPRRSQSSRLGSVVNHGIVPTDAVPISTASNFMVPEGIGDTMTPRAHKFIVVERK